jgi:hypothetical protein
MPSLQDYIHSYRSQGYSYNQSVEMAQVDHARDQERARAALRQQEQEREARYQAQARQQAQSQGHSRQTHLYGGPGQ